MTRDEATGPIGVPTCSTCSSIGWIETGYRAKCGECGARTDWFESEKEALAAWRRMDSLVVKRDKDSPTAEEFWENK